MNQVDELKLHVDTLVDVVNENKKFFVAVRNYVLQLQALLTSSRRTVGKEELAILARRIDAFWDEWRPTGSPGIIYLPPRETSDSDNTVREVVRLVDALSALKDDDFRSLLVGDQHKSAHPEAIPQAPQQAPCSFIGHGHSKLWARLQVFLEAELNLAVTTYESDSRVGESIIEVLETMLRQATFAILVLTAEDEAVSGAKRARQNVIHEAGLFQGRLGFRRAILLKQAGVEDFTNVAGLQHIPFDGESIEQTFYEVQRALKREGQIG